MTKTKYIIGEYDFMDAAMYEEARKEYEAIRYMREKTDLTDPKHAMKLYQKMNERPSFHTIAGYDFMQELRDVIIKSDLYQKEDLERIKVEPNYSSRIKKNKDSELEADNLPKQPTDEEKKLISKQVEEYKVKLRNTRIIVSFLIVIILAFIYISKNSDYGMMSDYETTILNKYSSWEETLSEREAVVEAQEKELEKNNNE